MHSSSRKFLLFQLFLTFAGILMAQQDPQFSQILYNPMSINPGYAGSQEMIGVSAFNKLQWAGFG